MDFQLEKDNYSKEEVQGLLDKFVQSECDKVRTDYSKRLKAAEAERDALKPAEKSQAELDLETRAAELSKREKAFALREAGLAPELADLLQADADISKLTELLNAGTGYVPAGHRQGGLSKAEFENMSYSERAALYAQDPNLVNTLI